MANEPQFIKLGQEKYDAVGFRNEDTLYRAGLSEPDKISQKMTYLSGLVTQSSPFMWMTAGQGGYKTLPKIELEGDGQFTWDVMGELRQHGKIVGSIYVTGDQPGRNRGRFLLNMEDNWLKEGMNCTFEDQYVARISQAPIDKGTHWEYEFETIDINVNTFCALTNLKPGKLVREGSYTTPASLSVGTETTSQTPMKRTNQISYIRNSDRISGNIANKMVKTFEFPISDDGKKTTKKWMPFQYWQWLTKDEMNVERFLFKTTLYNRDENGRIHLKDRRSGGQPVPMGASIDQMIDAEGNSASYGADFSIEYFNRTVGDMFYGLDTSMSLDVIAYCGTKYMEDFDKAVKTDANNNSFTEALGDQMIGNTSSGLSYGKYFRQYKTSDGHVITLKKMPWLDDAGVSEQVRHPISGKPISSHSAYFITHSLGDDGEPNIQMTTEKGRTFISGVYSGLTPIPDEWKNGMPKGNNGHMMLSTEKDEASIHTFRAIGINARNTQYMFKHYSDINSI